MRRFLKRFPGIRHILENIERNRVEVARKKQGAIDLKGDYDGTQPGGGEPLDRRRMKLLQED